MKKTIIGLGEILWDMLPGGKALGGAPANFAYHAGRLGEDGWVISAIADDPLGNEILDSLKGRPIHSLIQTVSQPTGTVQVTLDEKGVPSYNITENVAWDNIPFTEDMKEVASRADAVCFGSLVQRMPVSEETVFEVLNCVPESCLKVFDINLRQHYYEPPVIMDSLNRADVLKINDEEIEVVADMLMLDGTPEEVCRYLIMDFDLKFVILTKGAEGSCVVTPDEVIPCPAADVEVVDTVGAGDAFTAAFVVNYLRGKSLGDCQKAASETAGYVCAHKGAMPE